MDVLVGTDPLDDLRRFLGLRDAIAEQAGRAQDRLAGAEPDLGAELDDQEVHQQREHALDLRRQLRHEPGAGLRAGDVLRRVDVRVGAGAEGQVAGGEPHRIVRTDARHATLVPAVRLQHPLVEVAERHLADRLDDVRREVGERHVREQPATRLDLADDRQGVPERLAETMAQQHPGLLHRRQAGAAQQGRLGIQRGAATGPQRGLPRCQCLLAPRGAGRLVRAVRTEPAVHPRPVDDLRLQRGVLAEQLFLGVDQAAHAASVGRGRGIVRCRTGHRRRLRPVPR